MRNSSSVEEIQAALDKTIGVSYPSLLRVAAHCLRSESAECDLEPNELVHEAYLRLLNVRSVWLDDRHFLNLAGQIMRCVLCDRARGRCRLKRGAQPRRVSLETLNLPAAHDLDRIVVARQRVRKLIGSKARWGRVAELRMEGYKIDEIALFLEVSSKTVKRDWKLVKTTMRSVCEHMDLPGESFAVNQK